MVTVLMVLAVISATQIVLLLGLWGALLFLRILKESKEIKAKRDYDEGNRSLRLIQSAQDIMAAYQNGYDGYEH